MRPTLYAYGPNEDALSREHAIVDHAERRRAGPLLDDRRQARELPPLRRGDDRRRSRARFDRGVRVPHAHVARCPGGDARATRSRSPSSIGIDAVAARRLVYRHGSRAERDRRAHRASGRASATVVCACEPVLEAEVRYVVEHELARTVDDVARRTRLGLGACGGMRCAARCGQIVAQELDLAPREGLRRASLFLQRQASARRRARPGAGAARGADPRLDSIQLGPIIEEDESAGAWW